MKATPTLARAAALAALLALASCNSNRAFDAVDANDNRRISSDEFVAHVQRSAFDEIDTDGNVFLDSDEWKMAETTNEPRKRFARLDTNRDGRLSFKEFSSAPKKSRTLKRIFGTADRDSDGYLTPEELGNGTTP